MMTSACTCGHAEDHEIARRQTADGTTVALWSDGQVTWRLGMGIRGIGRARSKVERALDLRAGWIVMAEVELYLATEVTKLITAARRAVRQPGHTQASELAFVRLAMAKE